VNNPVILTNIPAQVSPTWTAHTSLLEGCSDTTATDPHISGPTRALALKTAWRLFRKRAEVDCFVTTGNLTGLALAFLQSICFARKKPHFIMSAIWTYPRNPLEQMLRHLLMPFAYRSVTSTFVNTRFEVEAYSRVFGIPAEKLEFLPYSYRLTGYEYEVSEGDYIWSGGNGDRDYRLLANAVAGLQVPVLINATRASLFQGFELPPNVKVEGVNPADFRRRMGGCRFAVIPMVGNRLHPGGQQTFLSLMKMGKAVILTDPVGGSDYIEHGRTGFLVPPNDSIRLRETIRNLLEHPETVREIGENAKAAVAHQSEDAYMASILEAVRSRLQ